MYQNANRHCVVPARKLRDRCGATPLFTGSCGHPSLSRGPGKRVHFHPARNLSDLRAPPMAPAAASAPSLALLSRCNGWRGCDPASFRQDAPERLRHAVT